MNATRIWLEALTAARTKKSFIDSNHRNCHSLRNALISFPNTQESSSLLRAIKQLGYYYPSEDQMRRIAIGKGDQRGFGKYINAQLPRVISLLRDNIYTRRAIIQLTDHAEYTTSEEYMPTLLSINLEYENDRLHITVHARSLDLLLSTPVCYFQAAALLEYISSELGVKPGEVTFFINSAHIFDDYDDNLQELTRRYKNLKNPNLRFAVHG